MSFDVSVGAADTGGFSVSDVPQADGNGEDFDSVLRGQLADPTQGAGLVAYDPEQTYPTGTVGATLETLDQTLRMDLADSSNLNAGAGLVAFNGSLSYITGTVGAQLVANTSELATHATEIATNTSGIASLLSSFNAFVLALASTIGATLVGLVQAGAGAVLRTIQDKLRETVSVIDYGGVLNDSSAGARTANTAALTAALAVRKRPFVPEGEFWIATNTPLAAFWDIEGAGAEASIIKGDGDLFSVTTADNGEMRRFRNLKIMNDVTKGKLFKYVSAIDTNRIQFDNVNFDKANYHVHASGGGAVVSPSFNNCRFINASIESRHFEGLWVYSETSCYTWYCGIGLRCTNGAVSDCSIRGSTYEQMDDSAIVLDASNTSYEVAGLVVEGTHFEANGKVNHNADVQLLTSAATRLRGIKFVGGGFFTPTATQSVRVSVAAGGGGNIDNIDIDSVVCMGTVPLCTDSPSIRVRNVYYQSVAPQPTNLVPVQVQYQYSLRSLGELRVSGVETGSGGTVATLTAPVGVRDWRVTVSGNNYNGVPNTNLALNVTYMSGTTGNTRATTDANHSAGANQGFIVTYNPATRVITVANKAAMTATQSGEVFAEFFA